MLTVNISKSWQSDFEIFTVKMCNNNNVCYIRHWQMGLTLLLLSNTRLVHMSFDWYVYILARPRKTSMTIDHAIHTSFPEVLADMDVANFVCDRIRFGWCGLCCDQNRLFIGCCGRFGRGASLYRHRSQLFGRLWVDSHCRPGSFLRFNSRLIMYSAVGSLVLSWSWTRQPGFISFWCLWIQLCNNLKQWLCAYNLP